MEPAGTPPRWQTCDARRRPPLRRVCETKAANAFLNFLPRYNLVRPQAAGSRALGLVGLVACARAVLDAPTRLRCQRKANSFSEENALAISGHNSVSGLLSARPPRAIAGQPSLSAFGATTCFVRMPTPFWA